jgi:tRNA G10  N-methylase Trm11
MILVFILGHNPTLSTAEIIALLSREKINWELISLSSEILCLKIEKEINANWLQRQLGGTIKIGQILQTDARLETNELTNIILKNSQIAKKIYFGFSLYKLDETVNRKKLEKIFQKIKKSGIKIKKELREKNYSSRWVSSREPALSSVIVQKNNLLKKGIELLILAGKDKLFLGQTLAIQEFEEYSFRDYGRPKREMKVGLLPPKLAKIMINLAKINFDQTILDPFCGFGTILGEAAIMGYKNLIGSDIDAKTLEGAKQNFKWLEKNFQFSISNFQLLQSDVRDLSKKILPESIDAIITEPYLGPPLQGSEPFEKLKKTAKNLEKLYLASFKVFKKILKKNGKVVIVFPVFILKDQKIYLEILPQLNKMGFKISPFVPQILAKHSVLKFDKNNSILYERPGQKVLRQLLTFSLN